MTIVKRKPGDTVRNRVIERKNSTEEMTNWPKFLDFSGI